MATTPWPSRNRSGRSPLEAHLVAGGAVGDHEVDARRRDAWRTLPIRTRPPSWTDRPAGGCAAAAWAGRVEERDRVAQAPERQADRQRQDRRGDREHHQPAPRLAGFGQQAIASILGDRPAAWRGEARRGGGVELRPGRRAAGVAAARLGQRRVAPVGLAQHAHRRAPAAPSRPDRRAWPSAARRGRRPCAGSGRPAALRCPRRRRRAAAAGRRRPAAISALEQAARRGSCRSSDGQRARASRRGRRPCRRRRSSPAPGGSGRRAAADRAPARGGTRPAASGVDVAVGLDHLDLAQHLPEVGAAAARARAPAAAPAPPRAACPTASSASAR